MVPDYIAPVIAAGVFILLMGFVREPARRTVNALLVAGASGPYLSGGGLGAYRPVVDVDTTGRRQLTAEA